ncbi:uncharacterized protein EV154DRAFT_487950 [Mucor mucedo]|uniref:uncharacterized protein n=1 Tax=Mucor mucedo TaxID=29922 RepID=UPI002221209D|nr:uncharacterized protein EV154DRAFT_487950 [Mucor mucedo]KAI7869644.1 hypothetical protein EV154DRAFT_487950 [Mucor mucedo]
MSLALLTAQEKAERRREKNKLAQRKYQLRLRQQRIEENEVEETRRIRERNNLLKRKQRDSFTPEENEANRAHMRQQKPKEQEETVRRVWSLKIEVTFLKIEVTFL